MTDPNILRGQATPRTIDLADATRVATFLRGVYGWMFAGLVVTALVAFTVAGSETLTRMILGNRIVFFALLFGELGLVWWLSTRIGKLSTEATASFFLLYSALNGATLSIILLVYTGGSVANAFLVAAGMFGALALFGTITGKDLSGIGQFAFMGLIGVILASVVGIFWRNDALQFVISVAGVIIFTGLTAWDAQRLRQMALAVPEGKAGSFAIGGALTLYLDFINLFLFLLRFLGRRR